MQTLYVACVSGAPVASAFLAWDAPELDAVRLERGQHTSLGDHQTDLTTEERAQLSAALCSGSAKKLGD